MSEERKMDEERKKSIETLKRQAKDGKVYDAVYDTWFNLDVAIEMMNIAFDAMERHGGLDHETIEDYKTAAASAARETCDEYYKRGFITKEVYDEAIGEINTVAA